MARQLTLEQGSAWGRIQAKWRNTPTKLKVLGPLAALVLAGFAVPFSSRPVRPDLSKVNAELPVEAPAVVEVEPTVPEPEPESAAATRPVPVEKPAPALKRGPKLPPKPPAPAPGTVNAGSKKGVFSAVGDAWSGFKERISSRAAVNLADDFRAGLGDWYGDGNWARTWAYDQAGFVRSGALALYAPSAGMTDYRTEFMGQIDRRAVGWVIRAADTRNYQAAKLTVTEAGPLPKVVFERYAVVRGVVGAVKRVPLPFQARNDTSYLVTTEVSGNDFKVAVQGNIVDAWTESRLGPGGIGFFSGRGEQARIRWVSVTHQDDAVGKLCALLAPPAVHGK